MELILRILGAVVLAERTTTYTADLIEGLLCKRYKKELGNASENYVAKIVDRIYFFLSFFFGFIFTHLMC